jgi:hypothetical protein
MKEVLYGYLQSRAKFWSSSSIKALSLHFKPLYIYSSSDIPQLGFHPTEIYHIEINDFVNLGPLFFVLFCGWSGIESTLTEATIALLYQPRMKVNDDECGAISLIHDSGNRSIRRKPVPVPFCPKQIPHDLTRARKRATAVGSLRLTAWATARSLIWVLEVLIQEISWPVLLT